MYNNHIQESNVLLRFIYIWNRFFSTMLQLYSRSLKLRYLEINGVHHVIFAKTVVQQNNFQLLLLR